jgi:hypothetical protein
MKNMARGWESKSVEEQMTTASEQAEVQSGNGFQGEELKRVAQIKRAQNLRQKQSLNLQRENILSQRTSNPARRAALEAALKQIEDQIEALG